MKNDEFEFGLTIPQGWRGGDLPLEEESWSREGLR
jgi:hypothetical protein